MTPETILISLLTPAVVVGWLLAPYLLAFFGALVPALGELPLLLCCLATVLMALPSLLLGESISLNLIGSNGISLSIDGTAAWFLLLNGVVLGATRLASRKLEGAAGPLVPAVMLGGLNTCFVVTDLISLYVALEVVGIAAFLLQLRREAPRSFWIALRYLLVASTAMTLYLIGTGLVYVRTGSFSMEALAGLELGSAQVLILLGLFSKGGLFLPGLWLPRSHAAARPEVAALHSGVVVTAGVLPLLRLMQIDSGLAPLIRWIGIASAVLGLLRALTETDLRRLLAWSTLSQMGLVALSPVAGGLMAFAHGLGKALLFLMSGGVDSTDLNTWRQRPLPARLQVPLWIGSLSIAGFPWLIGSTAKSELESALPPFWAAAVLLASIGSVAVYARLWGAPWCAPGGSASSEGAVQAPAGGSISLLVVVLISASALISLAVAPTHDGQKLAVTGLVFALGLLLDRGLQRWRPALERRWPDLESLQDLIGSLAVVGAGMLLSLHVLEGWG